MASKTYTIQYADLGTPAYAVNRNAAQSLLDTLWREALRTHGGPDAVAWSPRSVLERLDNGETVQVPDEALHLILNFQAE